MPFKSNEGEILVPTKEVASFPLANSCVGQVNTPSLLCLVLTPRMTGASEFVW
jgi:hypothetical protein